MLTLISMCYTDIFCKIKHSESSDLVKILYVTLFIIAKTLQCYDRNSH